MEVWKNIDGFDGKYQISNFGNVRSFSRWGKGKLLKFGKTKSKQAYRYVHLVKSCRNDTRQYYIHRLVAEYFCPKAIGCDEVNHIDGDTQNNHADNLEWCTHNDNMRNAKERGVLSHDFEAGKLHPNSKRVMQYTKDGEFIREWESVNQIMRETGIPASSIFRVCNPKYKHEHTAKGFIWRFKDGNTNYKNKAET